MAKNNIAGFIGTTILALLSIGFILFPTLSFFDGFSFFIKERCILSTSLVIVLILGMKYSLRHTTPEYGEKAMMAKRAFGWILVATSIIGFVFSLISFVDNYEMTQSAMAKYSDSWQSYRPEGSYDWLLLQFAGGGIIFSGYIFAWGYYLVKSGPIYSPVWKRILKIILYIIASIVILDNVVYRPITGWLAVPVLILLMVIIIALSKDYVKEPEAQITEEIEL